MNGHSPTRPLILARPPLLARTLISALENLQSGSLLLECPDGSAQLFHGQAPGPSAHLAIRDWDVLAKVAKGGDIALAEALRDERAHTQDAVALIRLALANEAALDRAVHGSLAGTLLYWLRHLFNANTRAGSRRNIQAHYDLGNDFYRLWLDEGMTYSAALFDGDSTRTLEDAQTAKYERILQRLNPARGARLLEIGCGWGAFAEYAIRTRGVHVTGVTLSSEQLAYAQARLARAGLAEQASLTLTDYRDIQGQFDHIVSIEMLEAVGERWWPTYFATLRDRLGQGGTALVQVITIDNAHFARYRRGTDFIQQYIFPGGMLPSVQRLEEESRSTGLRIDNLFAFGADYALTLRAWRHRFAAALPMLDARFDAPFQRIWRFYLDYCIAGFETGRTDVCQIQFARP